MSHTADIAQNPVVIVAAARTPMGAFQGELATLSANDLGAVVIREVVRRSGIAADQIDDVYFGNCLMAGQGQGPARQAAIKAGLPVATGAVTLSKMCGSGLQAIMFGADAILAGSCRIVVAGGMESMTNAPYLLPKARSGMRIGHGVMLDHMMLDGLEDAYTQGDNGGGRAMGTFAEDCAIRYQFSRSAQDAFATASVRRAQAAAEAGRFDWEIVPVTVKTRQGDVVISSDEGPRKARLDKIATLKPAFRPDGTITAASSSSINDGAAAVILMRRSVADEMGITALASIAGYASFSQEPEWFTTAPVGAINRLFAKTGWSRDDVDLYEINEAFAAVPMAVMSELGIAHDKVNVHGGACAMGHPIGASGARVVVTLMGALRATGDKKRKRGIAALCIGGGEGVAIAIELL